MHILGIETSCDETGIAVYSADAGLIANNVYSQINVHKEYGGVVPELASRDHIRKTLPLIKTTLVDANISMCDLSGIAYTEGPGLMGALLSGASIAQSLAWSLNIPAIPIHHMEGHLLAPLLENTNITFPFLGLLVSGGHSMLIRANSLGDYKILGESLDDAVGEAFDKTAKLLGLEYPGGPQLAKLALTGKPGTYKFPRPMTDRPGLDFSFSGLKTFTLNTYINSSKTEQDRANIALAFEEAAIDTIMIKCQRAIKSTNVKTLVIAGGVSANLTLRKELDRLGNSQSIEIHYPSPEFCTDNGAMIAYAGFLRFNKNKQSRLSFNVKSRWLLESLKSPCRD